MTDYEFLCWIHERLELVHKDDPRTDFMHKLRAIIRDIPKGRTTVATNTGNCLKDITEVKQ